MFSLTWQTLPTVFSVPKTSFLWQKTNHICISEKKHDQPSNSLIQTAVEVTSRMVMHSSKQNRWPLAALRQQSCSRTDIMENPKMRREEKCQALLLKATGYQPRMDRVLTEPEESAKGAEDKKNWSLWDQPVKVARALIQNMKWLRHLWPPHTHTCIY